MVDFANDIDIMARTLYGEADARNRQDAIAIAWVIMNRVNLHNWPSSIAKVCLQPWQFSCWNQNDPMRERIIAVTNDDDWFAECKGIAIQVANGTISDPTKRSTHYYATYIKKPKWSKNKTPVYDVQHRKGSKHLFFNDIDTPPPVTAKEALDQQRPLKDTGTVKAATVGVVGAGAVGATAETVKIPAGGDTLSAVADTVNQAAPAVNLLSHLAEYGVWVIIIVLLAVIAFMVWRRYDDRKNGLR